MFLYHILSILEVATAFAAASLIAIILPNPYQYKRGHFDRGYLKIARYGYKFQVNTLGVPPEFGFFFSRTCVPLQAYEGRKFASLACSLLVLCTFGCMKVRLVMREMGGEGSLSSFIIPWGILARVGTLQWLFVLYWWLDTVVDSEGYRSGSYPWKEWKNKQKF